MNRQELITLGIGVVVIVGFFILGRGALSSKTTLETMQEEQKQQAQSTQAAQTNGEPQNISTDSNVEIYDVAVGTGAEAKAGMAVAVHYVGTFIDGRKFDSSVDRGTPFEFVLGAGQVIKGWDVGVQGMKIGGKRHLVIKPEYGYGSSGVGPIPGNTTLLFDVELLGVK